MPENAVFAPPNSLLSSAEIVEIVSGLVDQGIDEIRLTGGEPTLRKDLDEIVVGLSRLPLAKFGLTTNGFLLENKLPMLRNGGCEYINVSLDSLDRDCYHRINRRDAFDPVLRAVKRAISMKFKVKINVVIFRGINDGEIHDFIRFAEANRVEVRFLEYMRIGLGNTSLSKHFMPMAEIRREIESQHSLRAVPGPIDATARTFETGSGARVGFIASESQPFCSGCSRLRLSAKGKLRACIMSEAGIDLHGVARRDYPDLLKQVMALKPVGRLDSIDQPMHEIGG